jgi:hypothetical protein
VSDLLDPTTKAKKSAVERHHLFPKEYLRALGVEENRDMNQIANFALVEWNDNIAISDSPPSEYYPKYASRFRERDLQEMCFWHALPHGWENMQYQEFLEQRRKLIANVTKEGFKELMSSKG